MGSNLGLVSFGYQKIVAQQADLYPINQFNELNKQGLKENVPASVGQQRLEAQYQLYLPNLVFPRMHLWAKQ